MKAKIKSTEKTRELKEYLKPRVKNVEQSGEELEVETENTEKLSRIPGVETFTVNGEERDGIGGKPIHKKAFTRIETWEEAVEAFLATVEGYTLYIETEREWDFRVLKKYNSEIVQAEKEVVEELEIEELDENFDELTREQLFNVYQEFLTE